MSAAVRMDRSEVTGSQLAMALSKAQAAFPAVKKTRTAKVGTYSYQYADLSDLMHAVLPVLGKHELALTQRYSCVEGVIFVETCLLHASGEILSSVLPVSSGEKTPQQVGSLMTYMRRYAISALLGIASEDDDDAQSANDTPSRGDDGRDLARHAPPKAEPPAQGGRLASEKQRKLIWARAKAKGDELGIGDEDVTKGLKAILATLGFASSKEVTGASVDGILSVIDKWTLATFGEAEPPAEMETGDGPF